MVRMLGWTTVNGVEDEYTGAELLNVLRQLLPGWSESVTEWGTLMLCAPGHRQLQARVENGHWYYLAVDGASGRSTSSFARAIQFFRNVEVLAVEVVGTDSEKTGGL